MGRDPGGLGEHSAFLLLGYSISAVTRDGLPYLERCLMIPVSYHTFAGVRELYENSKKEVKKMGQNFHKGFVSEEIKNLVRQNFSREIEFYEFCKERLKLQLEDIQGQKTL